MAFAPFLPAPAPQKTPVERKNGRQLCGENGWYDGSYQQGVPWQVQKQPSIREGVAQTIGVTHRSGHKVVTVG